MFFCAWCHHLTPQVPSQHLSSWRPCSRPMRPMTQKVTKSQEISFWYLVSNSETKIWSTQVDTGSTTRSCQLLGSAFIVTGEQLVIKGTDQSEQSLRSRDLPVANQRAEIVYLNMSYSVFTININTQRFMVGNFDGTWEKGNLSLCV